VFIQGLERHERVLSEFDAELWAALIDRVTVGVDGKMTYKFKDGTEVEG